MNLVVLILALASSAGICAAKKGQTWFYKEKDCLITEEKKGDPKRLHKSGAYKTYRDICYDDETGRQSFMMSKDFDKNDKPWTYCMQMSMDNECSGKTVAMNVQTLDQCYNIPSVVGEQTFAMKSFRFEEVGTGHILGAQLSNQGNCGGFIPLKEDEYDEATCRYGSKLEL